MVKSIFNMILSKGKLHETERSSNKETFLHRYARNKDKARYLFARQFIKGDTILNVACGEGHGSGMLLPNDRSFIYGLDLSEKAITFAKANFESENLTFYVGDAYKIPFKNNCFSSIVSIETIEHLVDHGKFLTELKRVLSSDGTLILSSPDKIVEERFFDNPHHINLAYKEDLGKLLTRYFPVVSIYCQTPIMQKPVIMSYFSFIFSSIFLSKTITRDREKFTGTNCLYVCRNN